MKILMVADVSISKVIGGAERALFENSTRLAARGHAVHLLTRRLPWHDSAQATVSGVEEYRFDFNDQRFFASFYDTLFKSKRLFQLIRQKTPLDVINFHQPFSALGVIASPQSQNIRKVYTCHSLSFEEFRSRNPVPSGLPGKLLYNLNTGMRWLAEKKVLDKSDAIIVLSDFTRSKLETSYQLAADKIHLIPGGVDLKRFVPAADKTAIRKRLHFPADKYILFTVRNLVARMGLENLLAAFSQAVKQIPELFLVLGGRGPLAEKLSGLAHELGIENQVHFAGFIPEADLSAYYQMADLFILATKELEGFGLVTVEALASGLPVLGTPVGGTREILSQLDPELLFSDASPGAMSDAIASWVHAFKKDPDRWQSLSARCREFAERTYSWDDKIDQLEKILARLSLHARPVP